MHPYIQVLIVDDRPRSRAGLRALLSTQSRIEVIAEASSGQEAIQLVAERKPDVVLMDVLMPGLDGLQTTRLIKESWPDIKVIVLTMYNDYQAEALAAGADVFLIKGCSTAQLVQAIIGTFSEKPAPPKTANLIT
jgi:DNA-binding NarL/FixJ family response regulator